MAEKGSSKPAIRRRKPAGERPRGSKPPARHRLPAREGEDLPSSQVRSGPPAVLHLADALGLILDSPWRMGLTDDQVHRVLTDMRVQEVAAGAHLWRAGSHVTDWVGVISGLMKLSVVSMGGKESAFLGVGAGGWFGEATLMGTKERWYDAVAIQDSRIVCIPGSTFSWLVDNSLPFNQAMLKHISRRLVQMIETLLTTRLLSPDARVARCLASLCNERLGQKGGAPYELDISQEELGNLAGLSRQRVNHALKTLLAHGLLLVRPRGVTIADPGALQTFNG